MGAYILSQYFIDIYDTVKSMISGMSLTMKHLRNKKDLVATLQYPNEKWPQPERNIGFETADYNVIRSRLHVDIDDCIGCLQCERACPVDCIKIETIKPPKGSEFDCGQTSHETQKKMIVPRFSIDMSECMYCNLCVYPCPEECIFMVGGPNEPKHEIDYEYSKYVKHDLVFEFSNTTDQEIKDIGGQDYLDKRNANSDKIANGYNLEAPKQADISVIEENSKEEKKSTKHVDIGFSVFKSIPDKMTRGIAKKSYTYGRRNNMDMLAISKYVEEAINSYSKMSPEVEEAIKLIITFTYPEIPDLETITKPSNSTVDSSNNESDVSLFDIKKLNDIEDKMVRGSLKKIFMSGKRSNKHSNAVIEEMLEFLNDEGKVTEDLTTLLNSLKSDSNPDKSDIIVEPIKKENNIFDIKKLNDIEDKMIRGTAKKIYMGGKRAGITSNQIVANIKKELENSGKINSELSEFLDKLL